MPGRRRLHAAPARDSSGTPRSFSSCAMRLLIADGSMCSCSAARAMLRWSQTATNRRSVLRSMSRMGVIRVARDIPNWNACAFQNTALMRLAGMSKVSTTPARNDRHRRQSTCPRSRTRAVIREVGLRDGLQSIPTDPADRTQARMDPRRVRRRPARNRGRLVRAGAPAAATGRHRRTRRLREDAAGPRRLGARAEPARAPSAPSTRDADLMLVPLSASHAHSLANLRKTPDEVVAEVGAHPRRARRGGLEDADRRRHRHGVRLHDAGPTSSRAEVLRCMQALLDAGADRVSIADTVGYADPRAVRDLFEKAREHRRRALLVRPLPRHARPRARQRLRRARNRRRALRRDARRHRRLPACAGRERQRVERRPGLHARRHGHRNRHRHSRACWRCARSVAGWLEGETLHGALWRAGLAQDLRSAALRSTPEDDS